MLQCHRFVVCRRVSYVILFLGLCSYGSAGEYGGDAVVRLCITFVQIVAGVVEHLWLRVPVAMERNAILVVVSEPRQDSDCLIPCVL